MAVKKSTRAPAKKTAAKRGRPSLSAAAKKKAAASKKYVNRRSQATKKPPSARLKKRRASNVKAGYYPNPIANMHIVFVRGKDDKQYYFAGIEEKGNKVIPIFDSEKKKAILFPSERAALNHVWRVLIILLNNAQLKEIGEIHSERYTPKKR